MAELSAGYIITQSFRTYFKNFGLIAKYALSLTGMLAIYFLASVAFLGSEFLNTADATTDTPMPVTIFMLGLRILLSLGSITLIIALIREIRLAWLGQPRSTMTEQLHAARSLLWPYIYSSILVLLLQLIPFIILFASFLNFLTNPSSSSAGWGAFLTYLATMVIIIWLGVRYSLVTPAVAIDGVRGVAALKTSARLVNGHWWRMFWWSLVFTITLSIIIAMIAAVILIPIGFFAGINFQGSFFLSNLAVPLLSSFLLPLGVVPLIIIYENLKNQA